MTSTRFLEVSNNNFHSFTVHLGIITSLFIQQNAQLDLWILFFGGLFILPSEHFYILLAKNYNCLPVHFSHIYMCVCVCVQCPFCGFVIMLPLETQMEQIPRVDHM